MIPKLLSRPTKAVIAAAVLLPAILIGVPAVLAFRAEAKARGAFEWVTHTLSVGSAVQSLVNSLVDAETGQRGFLLTQRDVYLEPYETGRARVGRNFADLRALTRDNPEQQQRLDEVEPLIRERLGLLAETIALERGGDHDGALALVTSGRGKHVMDKIRGVLRVMADEEQRLLWLRQQQLKKEAGRTTLLLAGLVAASAACGALVLYLLRRLSKLEPMVNMCASSRTIEYQGEWLSFEEYLRRRFNIATAHGLSPAEFERLRGA